MIKDGWHDVTDGTKETKTMLRSFAEYLEAVEGMSWAYFDDHYSGTSLEQIWDGYDYYCDHPEEFAEAFSRYDSGNYELIDDTDEATV